MCLVELVTHRNNIVDRKLGGGVGLEHCRVVDVLALAGDCRLYGEELRIDVGHIHSRELYGESANVGGMDTAAVNKAGMSLLTQLIMTLTCLRSPHLRF